MVQVKFLKSLLILVLVVACKGGGPAPSDTPVVGTGPSSPTTAAPTPTPTPVATIPPIMGPTATQIAEAEKYLGEKAEQLEIFLEKELALELSMVNAVDLKQLNWRAAFLAKEQNRDFSFEKLNQLVNIHKEFTKLHGDEVLEKTSNVTKTIWVNFKQFAENGELVYQIKRQTYKFNDFCLDHKTFEDRDPNLVIDIRALKESQDLWLGRELDPEGCRKAWELLQQRDSINFNEYSGAMLSNFDSFRGLKNIKHVWLISNTHGHHWNKVNVSAIWTLPNLEEIRIYSSKIVGENALKEAKMLKRIQLFDSHIDSMEWLRELPQVEQLDFNLVGLINASNERYDFSFLKDFTNLKIVELYDVDGMNCPDQLIRSGIRYICKLSDN